MIHPYIFCLEEMIEHVVPVAYLQVKLDRNELTDQYDALVILAIQPLAVKVAKSIADSLRQWYPNFPIHVATVIDKSPKVILHQSGTQEVKRSDDMAVVFV